MTTGKTCRAGFALLAVVALLLACSGSPADPEERQRLEEEFERTMTGAVLEGYFTLDGGEAELPRKERYEIRSVTKIAGDLWTINARIQYGDNDYTVPVPVKIRWAGDTPMLSLTDVEIPGAGTFTARVFFYRGQYAGTWSSGSHGGHQFGRIIAANGAE